MNLSSSLKVNSHYFDFKVSRPTPPAALPPIEYSAGLACSSEGRTPPLPPQCNWRSACVTPQWESPVSSQNRKSHVSFGTRSAVWTQAKAELFSLFSLLTERQRRVFALKGKRSRVSPLIRQQRTPPAPHALHAVTLLVCARAFASRAAHSLTC